MSNHGHTNHHDDSHNLQKRRKQFIIALVGSIGVVYGDIGTSPLYAFREAIHHISHGGLHDYEVYGILSLLIWSLIIIVTLKYVLFLMRADNRGEGGILALTALVRKSFTNVKSRDRVMFLGVMGASLFYADAAITPAISVLSAVEGLKLVTPAFNKMVLPISMVILIGLFMVQKHGTGKVAVFFGPITIVWFLSMALAGVFWITKHPAVFLCLSPHYAVYFIAQHASLSFVVLGAVFLSVTGAEALYADMGHFGRKPIQYAWLLFIFPCLVLNYMGQGALILENPAAIKDPFFLMMPEWALLPVVILATMATIIASQAVITGAFSLSQQAIQLGFLPRMAIRYTSGDNIGQIYMPKVNLILLYAVLLLCILFQNSTALAAAYGIAVTGTMVITTILGTLYMLKVWNTPKPIIALAVIPLLIIESIFLFSNLLRVFDGGFIPLGAGLYLSFIMVTWVYGSRYLSKRANRKAVRLTDFSERLDQDPPHVVSGTAIFFTSDPLNVPESLIKNIQYNQIIHEHNIIVTVVTSSFPEVLDSQRLQIEVVSSRIWRATIHFGFMETPDIPRALHLASWQGRTIDFPHATYFLVRRKIIADANRGLPNIMDKIYIGLTRFGIGEHDFYKLPRSRVVELGVQLTI